MLKSYSYRILPDEDQKAYISKIFNSVRFVWNLALETRIMTYRDYKISLNHISLWKQLKELKHTDATWLNDCPANALQATLYNQDKAFIFFYKGRGYPKFKSKKGKQSFQLPQGVKIDFVNKKIFLPKIKWVNCVISREFVGKIKTVTVYKTTTGYYNVNIMVDDGLEKPEKQPINTEKAVGIDLGIKDFATTSEGDKFQNHRFFSRNLKRLRIELRSLSRKNKDSQNYLKQKLIITKLHEKIKNQRRDFLHKLSTAIIKRYDTICLENLNIAGMAQNRRLSRSINEMGWYEFYTMLSYKSEWYGKNIIRIGRFEPSSKICSVCGWHNKDLRLSDRTWTCVNGHVLDRDLNAAQNIKNFSFRTEALPVNVAH